MFVAGFAPRKPPFTATTVAGLRLWMKADSITGKNDGDAVTQWNDSSGQGNNTTQAVGGAQPTYRTSVQNGRPVVRFDGVDDNLLTAISSTVPSQASLTVLVCAKTTTVTGAKRFCGYTSGGWSAGLSGTAMRFTTAAVKDYDSAASQWDISNFRVMTYIFDSAFNLNWWNNGKALAQTTHTVDANSSTAAFAIGSSNNEFWTGDIAEVLVYSSALSDNDRIKVQNYLGSKYGINVN